MIPTQLRRDVVYAFHINYGHLWGNFNIYMYCVISLQYLCHDNYTHIFVATTILAFLLFLVKFKLPKTNQGFCLILSIIYKIDKKTGFGFFI